MAKMVKPQYILLICIFIPYIVNHNIYLSNLFNYLVLSMYIMARLVPVASTLPEEPGYMEGTCLTVLCNCFSDLKNCTLLPLK